MVWVMVWLSVTIGVMVGVRISRPMVRIPYKVRVMVMFRYNTSQNLNSDP